MESLTDVMVTRAIASHLAMPVDEIDGHDSLAEDLGLDALDLVLVALRLEENIGVDFPLARLDGVVTVDDLVALAASWLSLVDDRPTAPAPERETEAPDAFDREQEAFFAAGAAEERRRAEEDEEHARASWLEGRRRHLGRFVAFAVAAGATLVAAAWLPSFW
jgi:acyl carrier protein